MSKTTLFQKIQAELDKLNDKIDIKIIKGVSYEKEARRHRELLATLQHLKEDTQTSTTQTPKRRSRFLAKSPVHRRLKRGVVARLFTLDFAM